MSELSDREARIKKLVEDPYLGVTVRMKRPNKSDSFDVEENREYRKTVHDKVSATRIGFYKRLEAEAEAGLEAKDQ